MAMTARRVRGIRSDLRSGDDQGRLERGLREVGERTCGVGQRLDGVVGREVESRDAEQLFAVGRAEHVDRPGTSAGAPTAPTSRSVRSVTVRGRASVTACQRPRRRRRGGLRAAELPNTASLASRSALGPRAPR